VSLLVSPRSAGNAKAQFPKWAFSDGKNLLEECITQHNVVYANKTAVVNDISVDEEKDG
jgi:hypothetical protein